MMIKRLSRASVAAALVSVALASPALAATASPSAAPTLVRGAHSTPSSTVRVVLPDTPSASSSSASSSSPSSSAAPSAPSASVSTAGYESLAVAMTEYYAHSKGTTLSQFVASSPDQAASMLGVSLDQLSTLPTDDVRELDAAMTTQGLNLDTSGYADLVTAAQDISAKGSSLDATVVAAGASYASMMTSLHAPKMASVSAPGVNTALATSMPKEGLAFGLFLDKSLTNLITNSPDVFAQISSSGLGTPGAKAAWDSSMMNALTGSQKDLTSMLPSACGGVFLTAMASGDAAKAGGSMPASGGCGSCLVAGLYSHNQMSTLFNPDLASTSTSAQKPGSTTLPNTWANLPTWQKDLAAGQDGNLSGALDSALGQQSTALNSGCDGGSSAVASTAKNSLGKTLSFLND